MEKVRIHELAKVLNTNSKRIIEKLNEIDIHPKGPMSYLEPEEYNKLRQHLGMPPIEAGGTHTSDESSGAEPAKTPVSRTKAVGGTQTNTIIKRRFINREEEDTSYNSTSSSNSTPKRATSGSGLRAGYVVRDDEVTVVTGGKKRGASAKKDDTDVKEVKKSTAVKEENTESDAADTTEKAKTVIKEETVKAETNISDDVQETKEQITQEPSKATVEEKKEEVKIEDTAEIKMPDTASEAKEKAEDEILDLIEDEDVNESRAEESEIKDIKNTYVPVDAKQQRPRDNVQKEKKNIKQGETEQQNFRNRDDRRGYQNRGSYQKEPSGNGYQKNSREGYQSRQDKYDKNGSGGYQNKGPRPSGGYQPKGAMGGYIPGKDDDDDDRPVYQRKQHQRKEDKSEAPIMQKAEINAKIDEAKKEAQAREQEKFIKRESKKENAPKNMGGSKGKRNNKLDMPFVGEKKGVHEVFSDDFVLEGISDEKFKKNNRTRKQKKQEAPRQVQQPVIAVLTNVTLPESMTVKELAEALKKTSTEVVKKMLTMGIVANVNQVIDFATAEIISDEFGIKATQEVVVTEEDILFDDSDDENDEGAVTRPPVVVVMGHVDHGKTSLLDAIRSSHVVTGEAGGITQHIGAYTVNIKDRDITFLDTPGHEAFTAMRARGAQTTDIAILVVAADDGVMPQTIESINHAKAANVSIIVAVNKIDKPGANVEKVMQELTEYGIVSEEWGGDTIFVPVSAKKHENIDTLLEMILLTADVMELKANPNKQPKGTVIEAKLDKSRGPVATVLVQRGTLRLGDSVVTGTTVGRIRAMIDDKGNAIKEAGPSIPAEILGLPEVPQAGEVFYGITDEKLAKQLAEKRKNKIKEEQNKAKTMVSLDDLFNQIQEGNIKEINIIVKADVQGSVEAVKQSLEKLSNEDVRVKIIHGAVGAINESDISLAQVSNAMIIGFNVRPGANVQSAAEAAGVDMRLYTVIYSAIEDVSAAMKGMLAPTFREVIQGHAEIRQIYKVSGVGSIAGCYVTDGKITRNSDVRVIRDSIVVYEGKLASLKRFKDDVKEVLTNFECGMAIEKFNDIKEGDIVEAYIMEEVKPS